MQIQLWSNFVKKKNSTKRPADAPHIEDVTLKRETSLLNPTFILTIDNEIYNYIWVPDWGRYYFVTDIVHGNSNLCELRCTLDVLATYQDEIRNYVGFVERTSHPTWYNTDINDNAISVEDVVEFMDSESTYCNIASGLLYIVRIIGRGTTNGIGTFVMNRSQMQRIFSSLWGDVDEGSVTGDIIDFLQLYISNPSQYIVGCYSSPIGMSVYAQNTSSEKVFLGGHETDLTLDRINNGQVTVASDLTLRKPTSIYSDFRKTDPQFSQYTIYIPTIGTFPLSADIMDSTLTMDISADLISGDLFFKLKTNGHPVATYNSSCYSSMSIGTLNTANGVVAGTMQAGVSLLTANPVGLIQGAQSAFSPTPSVIGSQGGTGCVSLANEIVISCLQKRSAEFPTMVYGRPCCRNMALNQLSGHYIKCANSSIDIAGTESDKDAVNTFLDSGFYLE